jgi:hypothetical protein
MPAWQGPFPVFMSLASVIMIAYGNAFLIIDGHDRDAFTTIGGAFYRYSCRRAISCA